MPPGTPIKDVMYAADEVLRHAIVGVASTLTQSQIVNVDFADVATVMAQAGPGLVSIGRASGPGRAEAAAKAALSSPLMDLPDLQRVRGLIYAVSGGESLSLQEVSAVGEVLKQSIDEDANVIFGASMDPAIPDDEIVVTVIATGFDMPRPQKSRTRAAALDYFAFRPPTTVGSFDEARRCCSLAAVAARACCCDEATWACWRRCCSV